MKTETEEKQFVEEVGVLIEKLNTPPLLSRVVALLIMRMPEGVTFEEIVNFLNASKSSVSSALKFLIQMKHIVYYTKPGDRKRYFNIPFSGFWLSDTERRTKEVDSIVFIIEKFRDFKKHDNPEMETDLNNFINLLRRIQSLALKEIEKFKIEVYNDKVI